MTTKAEASVNAQEASATAEINVIATLINNGGRRLVMVETSPYDVALGWLSDGSFVALATWCEAFGARPVGSDDAIRDAAKAAGLADPEERSSAALFDWAFSQGDEGMTPEEKAQAYQDAWEAEEAQWQRENRVPVNAAEVDGWEQNDGRII